MKSDRLNEIQSMAKMAGRQVIVKSWTQVKAENAGQFINSRLYWVTGEDNSFLAYAIVAPSIQAAHKLAKAIFTLESAMAPLMEVAGRTKTRAGKAALIDEVTRRIWMG